MIRPHRLLLPILCSLTLAAQDDPRPWLELAGAQLPGTGKHIVFVTGDEEYRSEEGMPQLARILSTHHGFRCTVLFSINKQTGEIDPTTLDNIPGIEALDNADLMVIFTRFRDLPDAQMQHIVDYVESGRPIIGLRTATHAFQFKDHATYRDYSWGGKGSEGGFGRQVLGETWVDHHGAHGRQSTRGIPAPGQTEHPILRGINPKTIWDPADVYTVRLPMLDGVDVVLLGQVLAGMNPGDEGAEPYADPQTGKMVNKNNPMMPIAWARTFTGRSGKPARVFATTLGSAPAFTAGGTRRLLVNACYWALGMDEQISDKSIVDVVGTYEPTMFGFGKQKTGVKPADLVMPTKVPATPGRGR